MAIENLITEHIDIWTSAIQNKSSSGRGSSKKIDLYGIKKLRELILELAVRGKLVPQDPNDEPASVLLERISEEQLQSVKEKKIKKPKKLPEITLEEKLFALPEGWSWERLGNIGDTNIGLTYSPKDVGDTGTPVLRSANIQKNRIDLKDLVRVNTEVKNSAYVGRGDLLICARNGSKALVGKTAKICELNEPMAFGAFMAIFRSQINSYVEVFLNSPVYRRNLEGVSTTTINQITQSNLRATLCAVPPYSEQHRIVAKVDELMALCDQLEQQTEASIEAHQVLVEALLATLTNSADADELMENWQRISAHFDTLFTTEASIDQLKQTILQLAVMGKLVPQDPNDEPASVLLERIAEEKAQLVKDGKIKRQKALPPITDDEKPFELPEGWEWCRLQDITSKITDGDHKTPPRINAGFPLLSAKNVRDGYLDTSNTDYIAQEYYIKSRERCLPESGDLLIVSVGGTIGRSSLVPEDSNFALVRSVALIKPMNFDSSYLKYAMDSKLLQESIHKNKRGGAQPCLYLSEISKFPFSMPPLSEQRRIVEKVRELLQLCDFLKIKTTEAQEIQMHLTNAIVEQAV
jgi:type I restriction enzyme, S subunit